MLLTIAGFMQRALSPKPHDRYWCYYFPQSITSIDNYWWFGKYDTDLTLTTPSVPLCLCPSQSLSLSVSVPLSLCLSHVRSICPCFSLSMPHSASHCFILSLCFSLSCLHMMRHAKGSHSLETDCMGTCIPLIFNGFANGSRKLCISNGISAGHLVIILCNIYGDTRRAYITWSYCLIYSDKPLLYITWSYNIIYSNKPLPMKHRRNSLFKD